MSFWRVGTGLLNVRFHGQRDKRNRIDYKNRREAARIGENYVSSEV